MSEWPKTNYLLWNRGVKGGNCDCIVTPFSLLFGVLIFWCKRPTASVWMHWWDLTKWASVPFSQAQFPAAQNHPPFIGWKWEPGWHGHVLILLENLSLGPGQLSSLQNQEHVKSLLVLFCLAAFSSISGLCEIFTFKRGTEVHRLGAGKWSWLQMSICV